VILAQLRLDVVEAKRAVDVALVVNVRTVGASSPVMAYSFKDQPRSQATLAHGDVVLLAAGEVVEREGEGIIVATTRRSHCKPFAVRTLALVPPCASVVTNRGSATKASITCLRHSLRKRGSRDHARLPCRVGSCRTLPRG